MRPGSLHTRRADPPGAPGFSECQGRATCRRHRSPWPSPRSACHPPPAAASLRKTQPLQARLLLPRRSFLASSATCRQLVGIPPGCRPHRTTRLCSTRDSELRGPYHTARFLLSTISRTVFLGRNTGHPVWGPDARLLPSERQEALILLIASGCQDLPRNVRPSPPATSQKRARTELCVRDPNQNLCGVALTARQLPLRKNRQPASATHSCSRPTAATEDADRPPLGSRFLSARDHVLPLPSQLLYRRYGAAVKAALKSTGKPSSRSMCSFPGTPLPVPRPRGCSAPSQTNPTQCERQTPASSGPGAAGNQSRSCRLAERLYQATEA